MGFPVIDWTISVGNMVQMGMVLGTCIWVFAMLRADIRVIRENLKSLREKQESLSEAFTQLGNILTKVAVQEERMLMISKNIDELRHGNGFVRPRPKE